MSDLIERQAAIDMIEEYFNGLPIAVHYDMLAMIHRLPSAEPERKKGHWIRHPEQTNIYGGKCVECSECGEKYMVSYIEDEKFCRNCGAKMEVKE